MANEVLVKFAEWFSTTGSVTIAQYGLLGLFFTAIALNATFVFGIPMEIILVAFYYSTRIDPLFIAIFAGFGAAIGEMLTYYIGTKSSRLAEKIEQGKGKFLKKILQKARKEINAKGPLAVFILFIFPLPVDFVGIICGMMKMKPWKFFLSAIAGKIARYFAALWFAILGIELIARLLGL